MLKIAALVLASAAGSLAAAATPSPDSMLASNTAWWEKVTVTMNSDGNPQSCSYTSSMKPGASEHCDVSNPSAGAVSKASAGSEGSVRDGSVTELTFERRFSPNVAPPAPKVGTGDTLLGSQMLALNIDKTGKVKGCKVVAQSGEMQPDYSCEDAAAEHFQAGLKSGPAAERQGYMTVMVYGHSEHQV